MTTITVRVAAGGDDGYAYAPSTFNNNAAGVYFGKGATAVYNTFMRFLSVAIPKGSTINSAKITFEAALSLSGTTVIVRLVGNDIDDAVAPTNYTEITNLDFTTAVVEWSPAAWTSGTTYDSPDIADIIQEIIDRAGWVSGNDLQVLLIHYGSSTNAYRYATSYDGTPADAPLLTVDFTPPPSVGGFWPFF